MKLPCFLCGSELIPVEKIGFGVLISKEEPITARVAVASAVLEKGTERSDSSSWTDHDDIFVRGREMKMACWLDVDGN